MQDKTTEEEWGPQRVLIYSAVWALLRALDSYDWPGWVFGSDAMA